MVDEEGAGKLQGEGDLGHDGMFEFIPLPFYDRFSGVFDQVDQKIEVVDGSQRGSQHFFGSE